MQTAQNGALETLHWLLEAGCPVNMCDGELLSVRLSGTSMLCVGLVCFIVAIYPIIVLIRFKRMLVAFKWVLSF